ncbi:hypothetical protein DL770_005840 [Monosporascus sp. CRB-9-2]|nr:hypothetical protein DL770_005840 [Monosporascus sp. CRB-9-2]
MMRDTQKNPNSYGDYTVAVVCAMSFEMSAVRYMLDREHPRLPSQQGDPNIYVLGTLSGHNVVLACLPGNQGKGSAATVATNLARTFPSIKWRFLVGIGGGVPTNKHDIRLGDVVVSMPDGQYGGVVQYDLGKDTIDDFILKGFLWPPPPLLRSAVEMMRSDHMVSENKVDEFLSEMLQKGQRLAIYRRPPATLDVLFKADYPHAPNPTCEMCDASKTVKRLARISELPEIHYGSIASGDSVMKSAAKRDAAVRNLGDVLCFEMEAAGLATEFSCIVIRGISDYADSHKNDGWHHYAAAAAAACTKELLAYLDPEAVETASDIAPSDSNNLSDNRESNSTDCEPDKTEVPQEDKCYPRPSQNHRKAMLRERDIYMDPDPIYEERQRALRVLEHKIEGWPFEPRSEERLEFDRRRFYWDEEKYQFEGIFLKGALIDGTRRKREDEEGDRRREEELAEIWKVRYLRGTLIRSGEYERRTRYINLRREGWRQEQIRAEDQAAAAYAKELFIRWPLPPPTPIPPPNQRQDQKEMDEKLRAWDAMGASRERQSESAHMYGFHGRPTSTDGHAESGVVPAVASITTSTGKGRLSQTFQRPYHEECATETKRQSRRSSILLVYADSCRTHATRSKAQLLQTRRA